ncbi:hypothetical protein A4X13_0g4847 [Tilletia indica]|uniref:Uncharacterized protein n=1 Tax=Tilletia indica TaxID=43049 RepID=A0A177TC63_9BASI|nr:hypothetical protein A4X13_0g4847 [Tilletia indica]
MVGPIRNPPLPDQQSHPPPSYSASASSSSTPRRASCEFCRRRKIRCNGEEPCAACIQRKITCVFQRESPKGRPPRSSRQSIGSSSLRDSFSAMDTSPDGHPPPGSIPISSATSRNMVPVGPLSSYKLPHNFDIHPEDIATPFWVQLGGRQGTVASALQDMWDRYFGPKVSTAPQPAAASSSSVPPGASSTPNAGGSENTPDFDQAQDPASDQTDKGKARSEPRRDARFPQTTFDVGEDEYHWVADFGMACQLMIQGMVELSCNVYSQLGCTWIGKPFFFVHMMQMDPTQRMFDVDSAQGDSDDMTNPLDDMTLERILAMIEIFFTHNALAALFSKSMLIDQCSEYKLGRRDTYNAASSSSSSAAGVEFSEAQRRRQRQSAPPPSPLLLTTVIAEAIPDAIEDEEDELLVEASQRLRQRLLRYAERQLFNVSVEPVVVGPYSSSTSPDSFASQNTPSSTKSPLDPNAEPTDEFGDEEDEDGEDEETLYDLSTVQALVLIGARELCEGTSPRKSACYVGVVARMLSHMRANERAAPLKNGGAGKGKGKRGRGEEGGMPGTTYRAVNEEIRINVEWFITATAAWFFCQLERPLGSILPPASILRFPPLRICRSASLQMDKRRSHITSLRRQAQLVEQLWTCATVTVTVCLIHDLHPSNQETKKQGKTGAGGEGGGAAESQLWQEERLRDLQGLGRAKVNMLELCERIQRYLSDYLRDMEKNKAPRSALAFLEASFMAIYVHTLLPGMSEADINWTTGLFFRKHTFDLYITATKRILSALEPWASTSRTKSSHEMFSRRYESFQKQLADIFVLALDACQRGLRVIVEYSNTEKAFGETGREGGEDEAAQQGNEGEGEAGPARTASGWLMPTREVLEYIFANKAALLAVAEQAQLASGSAFLRVALHARRVEEGFTFCICQMRSQGGMGEMIDEASLMAMSTSPHAHAQMQGVGMAASGSMQPPPPPPPTQPASNNNNSGPFGFLMGDSFPGASPTQVDAPNPMAGMPHHLDRSLSSQQSGMGGVGSGSSSSAGGAFSIAGLLAPTGGGPIAEMGSVGGDNTGSYVSPALAGMSHSMGMGTTPPTNNNNNNNNAGVTDGNQQPFAGAGGDDALSSLWWNQQASALPLSLPTVTGPTLGDPTASFAFSSGWPTAFPAGSGMAAYPGGGGGMMGHVDAGSGMATVTNENVPAAAVNMDVNNNHQNQNQSQDQNNTNTNTNTNGMVAMDSSMWATATIPDSWLAATFYDNMEVLRMSGFTLG